MNIKYMINLNKMNDEIDENHVEESWKYLNRSPQTIYYCIQMNVGRKKHKKMNHFWIRTIHQSVVKQIEVFYDNFVSVLHIIEYEY